MPRAGRRIDLLGPPPAPRLRWTVTAIELSNSHIRLSVRPDLGGALAACDVMLGGYWHPLMRRTSHSHYFNDMACYVLAPWSNRLEHATLSFGGQSYPLRSDWPDGSAIHGDVKTASCVLLDRSPLSVRLECDRRNAASRNWPWRYSCTIRYQLDGPSVQIEVTVINRDTLPMPAGLGLHPFFATRLNGSPAARIYLNTQGRYPCVGMLPQGPATMDALATQLRQSWQVAPGIDDIFRLDGPFEAVIDWPGVLRAELEGNQIAQHAVIFSGADEEAPPFFCLEPVTHVNNGMLLAAQGWRDTGVVILAPGEAATLSTRMTLTWHAAKE